MSSPERTVQIVTNGRRLPLGRRDAIWSSVARPMVASSSAVQALIAAIDQGARITLVPVPGSPHKVGA